MPNHYAEPSMRQKIFSMGLAVETVSLYLLCCAVADAGAPITQAALVDKWNENIGSLDLELKRLEARKIIRKEDGGDSGEAVYHLADEKAWQ